MPSLPHLRSMNFRKLAKIRAKKLAMILTTLTVLLPSSTVLWAADSARTQEKKQAEANRLELQKKLQAIKREISKTENAKENVADSLEESEQAISEAIRTLRDLKIEQAEAQTALNALQEQRLRLEQQVEQQKKQLSNFLQRQYIHGEGNRMKLLLSGDNPNRINRDLHYQSYVSQTQAKMIAALHQSIAEVEENTKKAQEVKQALQEIAEEEQQHKQSLEQEKRKHAEVLAQLSKKLQEQKKQAETLQKDEQRLSQFVSRLNKLIEEQARAEILEKQRKARLERERLAQQNKPPNSKEPIKKPAPTAAEEESEVTKQVVEKRQAASQQFSRLKGQLNWPVRGEVAVKFGATRIDSVKWKGLFIKAAGGNTINAIASGTVVVSEWMRGYGNIVIVNHGGDYLSLYSYNQANLKKVGDTVKAGEAIATVGNSGGNEETGLYFEMRYRGQVFDPMTWLQK